MSLDHVTVSLTAASNQGQAAQPQWQFFGPTSVSNTSQTFEVNQQPVYIEGYNFGENDTVTVQMVSGSLTTNYRPIRNLVQLTSVRTKIRIDYPGIYKLLFAGDNVANVTVVGFPGTMTHDSNVELAEALAAIISNAAGGNTQVIFNDNGVFAGNPYFTFVKATLAEPADILTLGRYGALRARFILNGALTAQALTPVNLNAITEISPDNVLYMEVVPTGAGAIGALRPAFNPDDNPPEDSQFLFIWNGGIIPLPVVDNWAGAVADKYKIDCGGSNASIPAKRGCLFVYSTIARRWHLGAY